MKRFYDTAEAGSLDTGFGVLLDGRPLRTPGTALLALPSEGLAAALAEEWRGQDQQIQPASMPLTQIACTALDLAAKEPERVVEELIGFAEAELLCYRAEHPADLIQRQAAVWQPLLDWAETTYGARLLLATGILHRSQPEASLAALRTAVSRYDPWTLTALATAVRAAGSLVVGLALIDRRLTPEEAFAAAELDESYCLERWGDDPQATHRREGVKADLTAARRFVDLLQGIPVSAA